MLGWCSELECWKLLEDAGESLRDKGWLKDQKKKRQDLYTWAGFVSRSEYGRPASWDDSSGRVNEEANQTMRRMGAPGRWIPKREKSVPYSQPWTTWRRRLGTSLSTWDGRVRSFGSWWAGKAPSSSAPPPRLKPRAWRQPTVSSTALALIGCGARLADFLAFRCNAAVRLWSLCPTPPVIIQRERMKCARELSVVDQLFSSHISASPSFLTPPIVSTPTSWRPPAAGAFQPIALQPVNMVCSAPRFAAVALFWEMPWPPRRTVPHC